MDYREENLSAYLAFTMTYDEQPMNERTSQCFISNMPDSDPGRVEDLLSLGKTRTKNVESGADDSRCLLQLHFHAHENERKRLRNA